MNSYIVCVNGSMRGVATELDAMDCEYECLPLRTIAVDAEKDISDSLQDIDGVTRVEVEGSGHRNI